MRIVRGLTGLWRHWEAGRRRRRRICIRTTRFSVEPRRASPTIGIRIQFTWNLSRAAPTLALNAREPTPMRRRRPLRAAKNVQMLWRSAKKKLDQATTPRTCTASFGISWGQYIVSCYALDCGTRHPRCKQALPAHCAKKVPSPTNARRGQKNSVVSGSLQTRDTLLKSIETSYLSRRAESAAVAKALRVAKNCPD